MLQISIYNRTNNFIKNCQNKLINTLNLFGCNVSLPIIQMGFLMNLSRPQNPIYFDRHPADHKRTRYSAPKKTTKHISWKKNKHKTHIKFFIKHKNEKKNFVAIKRYNRNLISSTANFLRLLALTTSTFLSGPMQ